MEQVPAPRPSVPAPRPSVPAPTPAQRPRANPAVAQIASLDARLTKLEKTVGLYGTILFILILPVLIGLGLFIANVVRGGAMLPK